MTGDETTTRIEAILVEDLARARANPRPNAGRVDGLMDAIWRVREVAREIDAKRQVEERAEEIARWNPRHAIEGWAGGFRAQGDDREAQVYDRALAIQDSWKEVGS
jgi:hypothetical protein